MIFFVSLPQHYSLAIYYFYEEYHRRMNGGSYEGQFDNLLFYFRFNRNLISGIYTRDKRVFPRIPDLFQQASLDEPKKEEGRDEAAEPPAKKARHNPTQ